jgi:hypothetical protein
MVDDINAIESKISAYKMAMSKILGKIEDLELKKSTIYDMIREDAARAEYESREWGK